MDERKYVDFIARKLLAVGLRPAIAAMTACVTVTAVLLSLLVNIITDNVFPIYRWLVPASLIPVLITPVVASVVLTLMHQLADARTELQKIVDIDPLTGAYNRRRMIDFGYEQSQLTTVPYSVILLDVDHFKNFNDQYGHEAGDKVLVLISDACRSCLRSSDLLSRWGGEEFVILLPLTDLAGALAVAMKLRAKINAITEPGISQKISASIGVSEATIPDLSFDQALKSADEQMYLAKRAGRNQVMPPPLGIIQRLN